jgi:hypothetical protein
VKQALLTSAVIATVAGLTMAGQRRLTLPEAERLVRAAISDEAKGLQNFYLKPPPTAPQHGATFDVWNGSASGKVPVASVVVDIDTAEVWDAATCQRLSTPALKALQAVIRRELRVTATAVSRARAKAEMTGCSSLIDARPKQSDFHPARLITVDAEKSGARYTVTSGGCAYTIFSPVPLSTQNGEVKIAILDGSMYVIDAMGGIRPARFVRGVCG